MGLLSRPYPHGYSLLSHADRLHLETLFLDPGLAHALEASPNQPMAEVQRYTRESLAEIQTSLTARIEALEKRLDAVDKKLESTREWH